MEFVSPEAYILKQRLWNRNEGWIQNKNANGFVLMILYYTGVQSILFFYWKAHLPESLSIMQTKSFLIMQTEWFSIMRKESLLIMETQSYPCC